MILAWWFLLPPIWKTTSLAGTRGKSLKAKKGMPTPSMSGPLFGRMANGSWPISKKVRCPSATPECPPKYPISSKPHPPVPPARDFIRNAAVSAVACLFDLSQKRIRQKDGGKNMRGGNEYGKRIENGDAYGPPCRAFLSSERTHNPLFGHCANFQHGFR